MSDIRKSKTLAGYAGGVFVVVLTLVMAVQIHGRTKVNKSITINMPDCPIEGHSVPLTKTKLRLPFWNPLGESLSVTGTVQITDQTSSTVLLLAPALTADRTGVSFSRTVRTLQHAYGQLDFDKGCTRTDPYGSNDCHWQWGEQVTEAFQDALQEDITSGKLIADLEINNKTPLQFSCAICGAPCTFTVPQGLDQGRWDKMWDFVISFLQYEPRPDPDHDRH